MVDASYETESVFAYVRPRQARKVYALFGRENVKDPITRGTRPNKYGVKPFTINPNVFKDTLFARLRRQHVGKGYLHFGKNTGADSEYFRQFAAEKRKVDFDGKKIVVRYVNPLKRRNEAIDLYVYNLAGLRSLGTAVTGTLGSRAKAVAARAEMEETEREPSPIENVAKAVEHMRRSAEVGPRSQPSQRPRGGFVRRF